MPDTPADRARAFIRRTEKRFVRYLARRAAIEGEETFWSDFWMRMGLSSDPSYQEAMQVYKEYLEPPQAQAPTQEVTQHELF